MASVAAPAVTRWSESFVSLRGVDYESCIIDDMVVKAVVDVADGAICSAISV